MTVKDIVRAWRDPLFRSSLSETDRAQLPENPAGMIELHGTALDVVAGASDVGDGSGSGSSGSSGSGSSRSSKSSKSSKSHKSGSGKSGHSGSCK